MMHVIFAYEENACCVFGLQYAKGGLQVLSATKSKQQKAFILLSFEMRS